MINQTIFPPQRQSLVYSEQIHICVYTHCVELGECSKYNYTNNRVFYFKNQNLYSLIII